MSFATGIVGALAMLWSLQASAEKLQLAVPVDPIEAVVAALKEHQVVTVGETHQLEADGRFWLRLLRDARVTDLVDDVVLEAGTATHQALMDRFVRGEHVSYEQLRKVLENDIMGTFDVPMYEELYWAVRARNLLFPAKRPMRVLFGEPGIDWSKVKSHAEFETQVRKSVEPDGRRDYWLARRISEEVLSKGRKALVLQGRIHALKTQPPPGSGPEGSSWEMSILRTKYGAKVFSIMPVWVDLSRIDARVSSWPTPFLIQVANTAFGKVRVSSLLVNDPKIVSELEQYAGPRDRVENQIDAIVVLEPSSQRTFTQPARSQCTDQSYIDRRMARMRILSDGASAAADEWLEAFTARCERTVVCHSLYKLPELTGAARVDGRCGT